MAPGHSVSRIVKKTDTSTKKDKPVSSGQSQVSAEKAKNSKNGLRTWRSEVGGSE